MAKEAEHQQQREQRKEELELTHREREKAEDSSQLKNWRKK